MVLLSASDAVRCGGIFFPLLCSTSSPSFSLSFRLFISFIFIATSWPVSHLKRDVCTFRCFCWIIFRHTSKCTCHRCFWWLSEQTMRFYRIILLQIIRLWSCFTIDLLTPKSPYLTVCAFISCFLFSNALSLPLSDCAHIYANGIHNNFSVGFSRVLKKV